MRVPKIFGRLSAPVCAVSVLLCSNVMAQESVVRDLRLVNPSQPKFPLVLRSSGSATARQNLTFPATLPTVGQVLQASAIAGPDVTTVWATPSASGGFTIVRNATTDATADNANYQDAVEMTVAVLANTSYTVDCLVRTQNLVGNHNTDFSFTFPSGTMTYSVERADANGGESAVFDAASPAERVNNDSDGAIRVFRLQGVLYVGGTAGNLQFRFRCNGCGGGGDQVQILAGSYLSVGR
ncbi:MAG: hypothetical protein NTX15_09970 [Candidatus Kapabacteria bacterium]|nr:hypothetical protein [Candidatus Kapabacteria bacterium]